MNLILGFQSLDYRILPEIVLIDLYYFNISSHNLNAHSEELSEILK